MLDLQSRVHLDEVELAALIEELERADAAIAQAHRRFGREPPDARTCLAFECWGGRLLEDFLVTSLQRAIAFAEMDHDAVQVGENLHFDMSRLHQVLLEVEFAVAERRQRLGARPRHRRRQVRRGVHHLHAASATAGCRLDHDREADRLGDRTRFVPVRHRPLGTGDDRNAGLLAHPLRRNLIAHHADVLRRRADEDDSALLDHRGKVGVLREKAVSGMDGLGVADRRGSQDGDGVQVTFGRRRRADADRLVGEPDVHGVGVGRRMYGDGANPHLAAGADDAERDFSPVGDQDLVEHERVRRSSGPRAGQAISSSGSPYSTGMPLETNSRSTQPARCALIGLKTFIASISSTVSPAAT